MKNIIIAIVISILIFGCGKKEEAEVKQNNQTPDTSGVITTIKDNNPPADVILRYNLEKNKHYSYRLTTMSSSMSKVIADTTMQELVKQNITYLFDLEITDIDDDKIMDIKATIKNVKLEAEQNGQKFSYNSNEVLDSTKKKQFMEYEAILNNPFYFRLDPKGEITEIYRTDKIINKFLEMQNLKDSVTIDMKKQLQMNIQDGALKPLLVQIFRTLPKSSVAKDSSWVNKYNSQLAVFQIENTAKYKIIDFEKAEDNRYAVISAGLDISAKGKNKVSERGVDYDFKTPEAKGTGKIYFNLTKGLIEKSKTSTTLKISMSMNMPNTPQGPQKAKRDDLIESTNIVELL